MTQPLDFTSSGRNRTSTPPTPPPPSPKAPKRPPKAKAPKQDGPKPRSSGDDSAVSRRLLIVFVVVVVVGGGYLLFGVFDVFGGGKSTSRALQDVTNTNTYCALASNLDSVAIATGASTTPGAFDGGADKIKAAVEQMGPTLADLKDDAPGEIHSDTATVVDGLEKAAAGDATAVTSPAFTKSLTATLSYRSVSCGGGGSGDGEG